MKTSSQQSIYETQKYELFYMLPQETLQLLILVANIKHSGKYAMQVAKVPSKKSKLPQLTMLSGQTAHPYTFEEID